MPPMLRGTAVKHNGASDRDSNHVLPEGKRSPGLVYAYISALNNLRKGKFVPL
jgi:hypothetical protein